jgi:hypothetical protein
VIQSAESILALVRKTLRIERAPKRKEEIAKQMDETRREAQKTDEKIAELQARLAQIGKSEAGDGKDKASDQGTSTRLASDLETAEWHKREVAQRVTTLSNHFAWAEAEVLLRAELQAGRPLR